MERPLKPKIKLYRGYSGELIENKPAKKRKKKDKPSLKNRAKISKLSKKALKEKHEMLETLQRINHELPGHNWLEEKIKKKEVEPSQPSQAQSGQLGPEQKWWIRNLFNFIQLFISNILYCSVVSPDNTGDEEVRIISDSEDDSMVVVHEEEEERKEEVNIAGQLELRNLANQDVTGQAESTINESTQYTVHSTQYNVINIS